MTYQHCVSSLINSDSEKDMMYVNMSDDNCNDDDSDDTAFNFSEETDLMNTADYREDSKNDISDLTDLLTGNEHLSEYYMKMMTDSDRFLLQYDEYMSNSLKLLNCMKQK
ncbi:hypothetical protein EMCG_07786 [[Emmonsia] crescens]|uniref:Uncharacterized protein n=1 Tax=[Emmonsia] crescens TaxID=73230 RepID=A0A0G2I796_9EURO|nr:hypothetical protein EMCG_07786 [Emmonsia crescens UAMH 3008]